jgi:hypothetical protein
MDVATRTRSRCLPLNIGGRLLAVLAAGNLAGCALGGAARMPSAEGYEAGRAFLVGKQAETPGYGLYSYLLFAAPPAPAAKQRYLETVGAYLEYVRPIAEEEQRHRRERLNVMYVLVTERPPPAIADFRPRVMHAEVTAASAAWVVDHYDYARAAALLSALGRGPGDGPYLVSALRPLSGSDGPPGPYLRQDLSRVPPDFTRAWLKEFLRQADSPREWDKASLGHFTLTVRTAAAQTAQLLPSVRDSVGYWIHFAE